MEAEFEKKLQDNLEYERDQQRKREEEEALEQLRQQEIELQSIASTTDTAMMDTLTPRSPDTEPKHPSDRGTSSAASGVTSRQARLDALQSMLAMVDQSIVQGSDLPWDLEPNRPPPPLSQPVVSIGFQDFKVSLLQTLVTLIVHSCLFAVPGRNQRDGFAIRRSFGRSCSRCIGGGTMRSSCGGILVG